MATIKIEIDYEKLAKAIDKKLNLVLNVLIKIFGHQKRKKIFGYKMCFQMK